MKAENLRLLKERGFRVPEFITVYEGGRVDLSFSGAPFFAVRSSFVSEDDEQSAMAGRFLTLLNVARADVENAVQKVRESYKEAERENRNADEARRGVKGQSVGGRGPGASPVIVQEMVDAELSGVMFTANPLGILNETVITIGYGPGSGVVEDRTETATYFYNQDEKTFYLKEESAVPAGSGLLRELAAEAEKIRELFGREMDIEFAVKEGTIYFLQARPVTTLRGEKVIILDNSNIVESYPGVSLPATQDFVHAVYRDIFRSCVRRFTGDEKLTAEMEDTFDHMVAFYNGAVYYQITSWYEILRLLPCSERIIRVWQDMLGVRNRGTGAGGEKAGGKRAAGAHLPRILQKTRITLSFVHYLVMTPRYMEQLNRYFDKIYPLFRRKIKETESVEELARLFERLERSITGVWDITLINDMYTFLFTALAGGKKNRRLADIRNMESMKPVNARARLRELAAESGTDSGGYLRAERAYIEEFGDRVPGELKLETRTYRTDPELLREEILRELRDAGKSTENEPERDASAADDAALSDAGVFRFLPHPFLEAAKRGIADRERSRLNRSRLFGLAREILLKIGGLLAANGQLNDPRDVFWLRLDEIDPSSAYSRVVAERKEQYRACERLLRPGRLVFDGEITEEQRIGYEGQYGGVTRLSGTGTSPGRVVGEALVIKGENLPEFCGKQELRAAEGRILVTVSTDPGWAFLLERCAGIIAERGSLLSHTAIISRELKKPAIVGVKDAVKAIRTGDMVELDADHGTVRVLKRSGADGRGGIA